MAERQVAVVRAMRKARAHFAPKGRSFEAALARLESGGTRKEVAARFGVTPKAVRHAESAVMNELRADLRDFTTP